MPETSPAAIAAAIGQPSPSMTKAMTAASEATKPTERSNSPITMTKVAAAATIDSVVICCRRFSALAPVAKAWGAAIEKPTASATKASSVP